MIKKEPTWKSWVVETTTPVFSKQQCEEVIKLGRSMPPQSALIGMGEKGIKETKTRLSHIS